jgi:peptidoglycan hydrolase CwlO-like protein
MFEELFTDWRFLLAAAAIVLAIGEARYKIRRHDALLNEDKIAEWNRQQATLLADVKNTSEDMHEMKKDFKKFLEQYREAQERIWSSHEDLKVDVARIQGGS